MKKPVLAFITAVGLVVATFACFGDPILVAQEQKTPVSAVGEQSTVKPLTAEEESTLENKVIKMELAARELSPEAIGKAVADLLTARQQAYQQLTQDLNTYTTALQIEGTTLTRNQQTGKFARIKK